MAENNAGEVQNDTDAVGTEEKTLLTDIEGDKVVDDDISKDSDDDKAVDEEAKIPENYEDFVMPEGMEVNTDLLKEFNPLAKELGLTQDKAQKLIDLYAKQLQSQVKAQTDTYTEMVNGWVEELKADKEFGGAKFEENSAIARKAVNTYGTPEFITALNETGMGNHPEFARFMYKVGLTLKEDTIVGNGSVEVKEKETSEILFPTHNT